MYDTGLLQANESLLASVVSTQGYLQSQLNSLWIWDIKYISYDL